MDIRDILGRAPVLPVVVLEDAAKAVPLARALVAGGLPVIEMTLRSAAALPAVRAIAAEVPAAIVGVGTVTLACEFADAAAAGARFAVSPGFRPEFVAAARQAAMPWLPGVMTPSEVMAAVAAGYRVLKLFPAEPAGGIAMLRALHGPFPDVAFCPTGGIRPERLADYLDLPNVIAVGGSWITPADAVAAGDWNRIAALAKAASAAHRV